MGLRFLVTPEVLSPRPETELLVEAAMEAFLPRKKPLAKTSEEMAAEEGSRAGNGPETANANAAAADQAELNRLLDSYAEDVLDEADLEREPENSPRSKVREVNPAAKILPAAGRKKPDPVPSPAIRALDLGTGSGCVAIALAAKMPAATVVAVDASPRALAVAKKNAEAAEVADRVTFRQGDWLGGCKAGERFQAILSNPPYLVEGDREIWPEVSKYDPPLALYGGKDGLDCYRRIVPEAPEYLAAEGWLFLEVGAGQAGWVGELLTRCGFREVAAVMDYAGIERVVKGKAPK